MDRRENKPSELVGSPEADEKTAEARHVARRRDRLSLLAIGDGSVVTHPLPARGEVVIGRGEAADLRINEPSISRAHARLFIEPSPSGSGDPLLRLEDLGSSNGTRVREIPLAAGESMTFAPGDLIELGATMFLVQRPPSASPPRQVWNHGDFEGRLAEECARGARFDLAFGVVRVHVEPATKPRQGERARPLGLEASEAEVRAILAGATHSSDVLASYGTGEYELLLVGSPRVEGAEQRQNDDRSTAADARARDVVLRVCDDLAARGLHVRTGVAIYPRDGRDPESLVSTACAFLRGEDAAVAQRPGAPAIVVRDGRMQQLHRLLERVAQGTINILLLGETGVGKEVMAERVHRVSPRASRPFLPLNCAALSESLLESELFGHERGAFTGAIAAKKGLLETAEGGTVFLDEIGELPHSLQVKLLRVLEERQVRRVGGLKSTPIDVRIVSATNRDLEFEVQSDRFRQDLFFRLNGVSLVIPPLRQRVDEIEELAHVFLGEAARRERRTPPAISRDALTLLLGYSWPGNIRELRNVIERAVLLCAGTSILPEHLPVDKMHATLTYETLAPASAGAAQSSPPLRGAELGEAHALTMPPGPPESVDWSLKGAVDGFERKRILDALEQCAGNQSRAAKMLGISRNTLIQRLKTYGIRRPRAPS